MPKKVDREGGNQAVVLGQFDLFATLPGDEPIDYSVQNGGATITVNVTAPAEIGIATIWDCDILIWAASRLRAAKAAGKPTTPAAG